MGVVGVGVATTSAAGRAGRVASRGGRIGGGDGGGGGPPATTATGEQALEVGKGAGQGRGEACMEKERARGVRVGGWVRAGLGVRVCRRATPPCALPQGGRPGCPDTRSGAARSGAGQT